MAVGRRGRGSCNGVFIQIAKTVQEAGELIKNKARDVKLAWKTSDHCCAPKKLGRHSAKERRSWLVKLTFSRRAGWNEQDTLTVLSMPPCTESLASTPLQIAVAAKVIRRYFHKDRVIVVGCGHTAFHAIMQCIPRAL